MKDLGQVSFYSALPLINGYDNEVECRAQLYRKDPTERAPLKLNGIMNPAKSRTKRKNRLPYESKAVRSRNASLRINARANEACKR